ncbi:MAG: hypothetical protein ACM3WS_04990 [Bacillota bacterium]
MQINQLSRADGIALGDLLVIFSTNNGGARSAAMSQLLDFLQGQLTAGGGMVKQYAAPNASGFAVTIQPPSDGASMWLLLTPVADYANLTINLPIGVDGQEILVSSTHAVTGALTTAGALVGTSNQPVNGAPATLAANGFFRLKFDGVNKSWYRIG